MLFELAFYAERINDTIFFAELANKKIGSISPALRLFTITKERLFMPLTNIYQFSWH